MSKFASIEEVSSFAKQRILGTLKERYESAKFDRELWNDFSQLGVPGIAIPQEFGGYDGEPWEISVYAREIARSGCDIGTVFLWLNHLALASHSILDFGTIEQKKKYLPKLAKGEAIGVVVVSGFASEGDGIRVRRDNSGYLLEGSKAYVTGGTVADLFLVVAPIEEGGERNYLSFLVDKDTKGVKTRDMGLGFLKTVPHSEVIFESVRVKEESHLCSDSRVHPDVGRAIFARERSCASAALSGLFAQAAIEAKDRYRQKYEVLKFEPKEETSWVHHLSALSAYETISDHLTNAAFGDLKNWREKLPLLVYIGLSLAKWAFWLVDFVSSKELEPTFPLDVILNDMKIVLVGEELLRKEGARIFLG